MKLSFPNSWVRTPPACSIRDARRARLRHAYLLLLMLVLPLFTAQAHESRPAYLQITQTAPNRYNVLWRTPVNAGMRLPVTLSFPSEVRNVIEPRVQEL